MKELAAIKKPGGFSLVEVVLAIGIVSFAMLAVVGLLPTGLKIVRNSAEQAQAANLAAALADSVRGATTTDGTNFSFSFAGSTQTFAIGASQTNLPPIKLTLEGKEDANAARLVAAVTITPPATSSTNGRAVISVAWPAAANPTWNSTSNAWNSKAEGSVTTAIQFLPRR
jgi:uncharacterized protein (TIGR02598 family)